jgi:hypothetical protein
MSLGILYTPKQLEVKRLILHASFFSVSPSLVIPKDNDFLINLSRMLIEALKKNIN